VQLARRWLRKEQCPIRYFEEFVFKKRVKHVSGLTLDWLWKHAEEFGVSSEPEGENALLWQVKHIVELMTMLTTLANHDIRGGTISKLTARALTHGAEFDWHQLAAYDASAATVVAIVADFFACNQLPPPFEVEFVHFLHAIGFFEGMDRVPFREMDLAYSLSLMISPEFRKDLPVWFESTTFGQRQHLTRYTTDDIYSVTHAAFYLTNFGRNPLADLLDEETAERLRKELVALTVVVLRADNIDVLGELLLSWLFCHVENTFLNRMLFHQAFERLLSATTPEGQVVPTMKLLQRAQSGETSFADVYHTTLVCCMVFAVAAKRMPYAG